MRRFTGLRSGVCLLNFGDLANIIHLGFAIMIITVSSCKPSPTLPVDEALLIKVLADVHIAEVAVQNFAGTHKDSIKRIYYQQIYDIHGISETDFRASLQVLSDHQEKMEKLYKKVEKHLESMDKPKQ